MRLTNDNRGSSGRLAGPDPTEPDAFDFGYVPRGDRPGVLRAARYLVADACAFPLMGAGMFIGGLLCGAGMLVWRTIGRPT